MPSDTGAKLCVLGWDEAWDLCMSGARKAREVCQCECHGSMDPNINPDGCRCCEDVAAALAEYAQPYIDALAANNDKWHKRWSASASKAVALHNALDASQAELEALRLELADLKEQRDSDVLAAGSKLVAELQPHIDECNKAEVALAEARCEIDELVLEVMQARERANVAIDALQPHIDRAAKAEVELAEVHCDLQEAGYRRKIAEHELADADRLLGRRWAELVELRERAEQSQRSLIAAGKQHLAELGEQRERADRAERALKSLA